MRRETTLPSREASAAQRGSAFGSFSRRPQRIDWVSYTAGSISYFALQQPGQSITEDRVVLDQSGSLSMCVGVEDGWGGKHWKVWAYSRPERGQ